MRHISRCLFGTRTFWVNMFMTINTLSIKMPPSYQSWLKSKKTSFISEKMKVFYQNKVSLKFFNSMCLLWDGSLLSKHLVFFTMGVLFDFFGHIEWDDSFLVLLWKKLSPNKCHTADSVRMNSATLHLIGLCYFLFRNYWGLIDLSFGYLFGATKELHGKF